MTESDPSLYVVVIVEFCVTPDWLFTMPELMDRAFCMLVIALSSVTSVLLFTQLVPLNLNTSRLAGEDIDTSDR